MSTFVVVFHKHPEERCSIEAESIKVTATFVTLLESNQRIVREFAADSAT
ncbi:MAG: hypothetical protein ABI822_31045 [Bryobacteraceae bacterium]